jgi:hypothetical protein
MGKPRGGAKPARAGPDHDGIHFLLIHLVPPLVPPVDPHVPLAFSRQGRIL